MDEYTYKILQAAWNVAGFVGLFFVGSVILSFFAFRAFGTKWLDTQFAKRLEEFKSTKARELENLKYEINTIFDRTTKIHNLEFEAVPEVWRKLNDAYSRTKVCANRLYNHRDISILNYDELKEVLNHHSFSDGIINNILQSTDKKNAYIYAVELSEFNKADDVLSDFKAHLRKFGIFIRPELRSEFLKFEDLISGAMADVQLRFSTMNAVIVTNKIDLFNLHGDEYFKSLEKKVQDRLWNFLAEKHNLKT